jgi:protein-disulfide isomerase
MFTTRFWSAIVITILTLPIQTSIVLALSPPEISRIAKKSVVRIDGGNAGTGFIVKKNGNTYRILTNAHVLKRSGNYQVITPDSSSYTLVNKRFSPNNIDLAEAEFTSDRDYPVAELGSSEGLEPGSYIYSYGWNGVSEAIESRTPQLLTGTISSIKLGQAYNGYNLIYTLSRVPGMSGSPIYNDLGKVIGIYGLQDDSSTLTLGISIDTYKRLTNRTEPRPQIAILIGNSPSMGATNQQIVMVLFADFQSPYCAITDKIVKQFMAKHKDKVTLVYKYFPLTQVHPEALPAARAAWAANKQGKFWQYHDALFANQAKLGETFYIETATSLKLDLDKFNANRKLADNSIVEDFKLGRKLGIEGVPTFIMNEKMIHGAASLADLERALADVEQDLSQATKNNLRLKLIK